MKALKITLSHLKDVFSEPLNIYTQFPWDTILKAKMTFAKLEENKTEQLPSTPRRFQPSLSSNPLRFGMGSNLGKKALAHPYWKSLKRVRSSFPKTCSPNMFGSTSEPL